MGIPARIAKFILKNLAAGAVSYVGGKAMGWILKEVLGDPNKQALADMTSILMGFNKSFAQIEVQLDEMKDELKKIHGEILYHEWLSQDAALIDARADIVTNAGHLLTAAQNDDKDAANEVLAYASAVGPDSLESRLTAIHETLIGADEQKGLLGGLYQTVLMNAVGSPYERAMAYQEYFEYYQQIQQMGLMMVVEAAHQNGDTASAQAAVARQIKRTEEQVSLLLPAFKRWLANGTALPGCPIYKKNSVFNCWPAELISELFQVPSLVVLCNIDAETLEAVLTGPQEKSLKPAFGGAAPVWRVDGTPKLASAWVYWTIGNDGAPPTGLPYGSYTPQWPGGPEWPSSRSFQLTATAPALAVSPSDQSNPIPGVDS